MDSSAIFALTLVAVSSALAPAASLIAMPPTGFPVVERLDIVVFGADLAFGHILEFYGRAVAVGAQDDVVKLLRCLEQGAGGNGGVQLLPLYGGSAAELTGRYLSVLSLQCSSHIIGVKRKLFSLVGFNQIRMAFWAPNTCSSPTPSSRLTISWTLDTR